MTLEIMKQRQQELGLSDARLATLTGIPKTTFYNNWNSDGKGLKHDFVARCCLVLGLSIDEDERTPTETSVINVPVTEDAHEEIMRIIAERLNEKNETIVEQARTIERLQSDLTKNHELFHELNRKNIERIDRLNAESVQREDRKNNIIKRQFRIITLLSVIIAALTVFLIYFMLDAFNGNWGLVRYLMELIPNPDDVNTGWSGVTNIESLLAMIR